MEDRDVCRFFIMRYRSRHEITVGADTILGEMSLFPAAGALSGMKNRFHDVFVAANVAIKS